MIFWCLTALVEAAMAELPGVAQSNAPPAPKGRKPPLSGEERQILRDRELLENLELLRNFEQIRYLEFFNDNKPAKPAGKTTTPGAGAQSEAGKHGKQKN